MKIAIIGQQDFGKAVLDAFLARGDEVAGVFCAPEKPGAKADPVRAAAARVPCFILVEYRAPAPKKPVLLLYRGEQARELAEHGVDVLPVDSWPLASVEWSALRQWLAE